MRPFVVSKHNLMKVKKIICLTALMAVVLTAVLSCDRDPLPDPDTDSEQEEVTETPETSDTSAVQPQPSVITISEFLSKDVDTTWYELEGTIITIEKTDYGNFWIKDSTGILYVYGLTDGCMERNDKSFSSLGLQIGDLVRFRSRRSEHNGQPEAGGNTWPACYLSHVDGETIPQDDVLVSEQPRAWLELPEVAPADDQAYVSYYTSDASGSTVRNYSMLYDAGERVALWVAYPLCDGYLGNGGRSEAWNFDPKIPDMYEPVIPRSWGPEEYNRGHQIPSADRTATVAMNAQTFYFANMTVQNTELNQGIWAELEGLERDWAADCDTLYVVTGPVLDVDGDGTLKYIDDNAGCPVAVPEAYFKAFLSRNISDGNYQAIAFYFENRDYGYKRPREEDMLKVTDLEHRLGMTLFSGLPDAVENEVKGTINYGFWGFAEPQTGQ